MHTCARAGTRTRALTHACTPYTGRAYTHNDEHAYAAHVLTHAYEQVCYLCECACECVYACTQAYKSVRAWCVCACVRVCVYACANAWASQRASAHACERAHEHAWMYARTLACTPARMHVCMCVHTQTHGLYARLPTVYTAYTVYGLVTCHSRRYALPVTLQAHC